jgi:hypothetical protein
MMGSPALDLAVDMTIQYMTCKMVLSPLYFCLPPPRHTHHVRANVCRSRQSVSPSMGLEVGGRDRLWPRCYSRPVLLMLVETGGNRRRITSLDLATTERTSSIVTQGRLCGELEVSGLSWHGRTGGLALDSGG